MTTTRKVAKVVKAFRSTKVIKSALDFLRTRLPVLFLPLALLSELLAKTVRFEGDIHWSFDSINQTG